MFVSAPHLCDVDLTDHVLSRLNVFTGFGDEDAFALAARVWFTDISFSFFGSCESLKVAVAAVRGETITLGITRVKR